AAGPVRAGPVHAVHAGDAGDGTVAGALGDDELARHLQDAVDVDRVRRSGLVGAGLGAVEYPVGRHQHHLGADGVRRVDHVPGGAAEGVPAGPPFGVEPIEVVENGAVHHGLGAEGSDALGGGSGVGQVDDGLAGGVVGTVVVHGPAQRDTVLLGEHLGHVAA